MKQWLFQIYTTDMKISTCRIQNFMWLTDAHNLWVQVKANRVEINVGLKKGTSKLYSWERSEYLYNNEIYVLIYLWFT